MVNPTPAIKDPLNIEELINQAEAVKKRLTHKQLMANQEKNLRHGKELLAKGKVLLAEGRKVLEGGNSDNKRIAI